MTTVAFDLFRTLVPGLDCPSAHPQRWEQEVAAALGVHVPGFTQAFAACADGRETGTVDFGEALVEAARSVGVVPSRAQVEQAWQVCVASVRRVLQAPRPGVVSVLRTLRSRGHRVVLCSNASADAAAAFSQVPLAALFDQVVFSCQVGVVKPHAGMYALVGCDGFFVGDGGSSELVGAEAAGLHAVQVPQYCGGSSLDVFDPAWSGTRVDCFEQLLELVP